jgi:predicted nucleic acid-binding protein
MIEAILLDTGPLGILTNPRRPPETVAALRWAIDMMKAGHRLIVPSIADFEVRRELERAGKTRGIEALDAWNNAQEDRYYPLSDRALRRASKLWAQARNAGTPTADVRELDCDVLIAAQALDYQTVHGLSTAEIVVATTNVSHLSLFVPADRWENLQP